MTNEDALQPFREMLAPLKHMGLNDAELDQILGIIIGAVARSQAAGVLKSMDILEGESDE